MLDFLQNFGMQKSSSQGHFVEVRKSRIWVIVGSFLGKPKEGVLVAGIGTELNRKHPSSYIHWRCGQLQFRLFVFSPPFSLPPSSSQGTITLPAKLPVVIHILCLPAAPKITSQREYFACQVSAKNTTNHYFGFCLVFFTIT